MSIGIASLGILIITGIFFSLAALDNQVSANNAKRQELVPKMWDEFGRAWQMDSDMKGIIQQYEDLNTLADRHEKLNLMWTSNFNKMDSNFRQIKKSVNFKVCTAKYPKMLAATTPKPYR